MIALTGSTNNSFNYVIRAVKRSTQNNTDDASVTEELNSVGTASTTEHQIFCQRRLKEGTEGKNPPRVSYTKQLYGEFYSYSL